MTTTTDVAPDPAPPAAPDDEARRSLHDIAAALRVQASRILELETEVDRLQQVAARARAAHADELAERCAALEDEIAAIMATRTMRTLALPRRVYGLFRRNGLHPRRWASTVLGRVRRSR